MPIFNIAFPKAINGVDSKILNPRNTWLNKNEYDEYARKVADMFNKNFHRFDNDASAEVKAGAPKL